jgi:excinuclease ABC subunit C
MQGGDAGLFREPHSRIGKAGSAGFLCRALPSTIRGVAPVFHFEQSLLFSPESSAEVLRQIPNEPGIFALRGDSASAEPYLTRAADLRRRLLRLLAPPELASDGTAVQSKRLNLRDRVRSIHYSVTGSEFASLLTLYAAASSFFGPEQARKRLRLHAPYFLRLTMEHAHPRVYTTNRLTKRGLAQTYGPFASRAAAERYCDAALDLFKLRRCYEDLDVSPTHPGCAYGEMKKCMAPCNQTCSAEAYAAEARAVEAFFDSHGQSMLAGIGRERDHASAEMEFERAAALHQQYEKVKAIAALAPELVRPLPLLRAIIVQPAARRADVPDAQQAAVFLLQSGCLLGPAPLSTLGVRAVKEQTSVGSSLFAQPLMLQAIPLEGESTQTPAESPELRAERTLLTLTAQAEELADAATLADHLSLLRRWYYRPEKQRIGEIFFPNADGSWPIRRILRGAARMALGDPAPMAETDRDAAPAAKAALKTKILHEGRPDVARVVPVLSKK